MRCALRPHLGVELHAGAAGAVGLGEQRERDRAPRLPADRRRCVPQSAQSPIGVTKSSEAMTPESRAMARSGRFSRASARTSALQVRVVGGRDLGPIRRRRQRRDVRAGAAGQRQGGDTTARLPLVMVDATVRLDEPDRRASRRAPSNRSEPGPRGERDPRLHARVRRQDHVLVVLRARWRAACPPARGTCSCTARPRRRPRGCAPAARAGWAGCARPRARCTAGAGPTSGGRSCRRRAGSEAVWMCRLPWSGNCSPGRSAAAR